LGWCAIVKTWPTRTCAEQLARHITRIEGYMNPLKRIDEAMSAIAPAERRMADERRGAMMESREQGWSVADIAGELKMSRARVSQLTQ